jgi:hydroxyacylglutathione hydrolase
MANFNRRGPRILGSLPVLYPLAPRETWVRVQDDGVAIDARSAGDYAQSHIPAAYSIPMGNSFGTWVGWLTEPGKGLVVVIQDPSNLEEAVPQLIRIGYDSLEGGMTSWEEACLPVARLKSMTVDELHRSLGGNDAPLPIDVRFGDEWKSGHVPGALHVELGDLPEHVDGLPRDRSYAALCAGGVRAATAASILEREGFQDVSLVVGGTEAWRNAGHPLEVPEG